MLNKLQSGNTGIQDGIELVTSILLRYSEIGAIHYWREQHALKLTFMTKRSQEISSFQEDLRLALEFFHRLEGRVMRICDIEKRYEENVCVVAITRDVESMTQREVGLIVELIKKEFRKSLLFEEISLPEDEKDFQEELISHLLSSIQPRDIAKNVVALREEGRVLVFKN